MENIGSISIVMKGHKGNTPLSPDNFDVSELIQLLEQSENLLINGDRKNRPVIAYNVEQGSVKHLFKTSMQYVIAFNAIIGQAATEQNLDFLDLPTAKAFEALQTMSAQKNYDVEIATSLSNSSHLMINRNTHYYRQAAQWVDAQFYFYGKITSLGGKEKSNIHLATDDAGVITIQTNKAFLAEREDNLLYKDFGILAIGKQNTDTGEIDRSSLQFVELVDYNAAYNEDYLERLKRKARQSWQGVDTGTWLTELRGGYDA